MRPSLPLLSLLALSIADLSFATAGPLGGGGGSGGGGRGPLGRTSSGIGAATGGGSSSSSSSGSSSTVQSGDPAYRDGERCFDRRGRETLCPSAASGIVLVERRHESVPGTPYTGDRAKLDFYAGAQKVTGSEGSLSIEAAISDGYRFRMIGTLHHYFETQPDMSRITMTMPTLMAGVRVDDLGATAVHFDAGVVHASTQDVMGDSSITGPVVALSVEHRLSKQTSILGDVRTMWFEDTVRANGARIGVRHGYLQASFRVLDFNVGPPLYGPEVGVRF
jgi:hypothetical protein